MPIDEAVRILDDADVPVSKIYSIADIVKDPQFLARGMLEAFPFGKNGATLNIPGVVPKLSQSPGGTRWLGPELGADTAEVLKTLGYDDQQIDLMRAEGHI